MPIRKRPVPASEVYVFVREAALGLSADESSIQPMTPARRRAFAQVMREVARIRAAGQEVEIPFDS